jgi:hypothetical protein
MSSDLVPFDEHQEATSYSRDSVQSMEGVFEHINKMMVLFHNTLHSHKMHIAAEVKQVVMNELTSLLGLEITNALNSLKNDFASNMHMLECNTFKEIRQIDTRLTAVETDHKHLKDTYSATEATLLTVHNATLDNKYGLRENELHLSNLKDSLARLERSYEDINKHLYEFNSKLHKLQARPVEKIEIPREIVTINPENYAISRDIEKVSNDLSYKIIECSIKESERFSEVSYKINDLKTNLSMVEERLRKIESSSKESMAYYMPKERSSLDVSVRDEVSEILKSLGVGEVIIKCNVKFEEMDKFNTKLNSEVAMLRKRIETLEVSRDCPDRSKDRYNSYKS